jgi:hypothetical protein
MKISLGISLETSIGIDRVVILRGNAREPDRVPYQRGDALESRLCHDLGHDLGAIRLNRPHADVQRGQFIEDLVRTMDRVAATGL